MVHQVLNLTKEQKSAYNAIKSLQTFLEDGTLNASEIVQYTDMTKKQKKNLVYEIYFKNKKRKEFYICKDGRVKSYNPQFIAQNEEELIDKLYTYYFNDTLESVYKDWLVYRNSTRIVSNKTIEEDVGLWKRLFADSEFANMQIKSIKPRHILKLFHVWTGNGLITRKDFNNRKALLNGIFNYAVLNEIIESNPIACISCNDLKFKPPASSKKAYTLEERKKLLNYLDTLEPDAYVLAIQLAFFGIFRIGEIKALSWRPENGRTVTIRKQLVEERTLQSDMTLGHSQQVLKAPKGNPHYSVRTELISEGGLAILKKMYELNPEGELLFMYNEKPLSTDRFNRRLKKYCDEIDIPYLSSHKIRFTGASILFDAGVKVTDIQPLLGDSNLAMTQHYIGEQVSERDISQMSKILI